MQNSSLLRYIRGEVSELHLACNYTKATASFIWWRWCKQTRLPLSRAKTLLDMFPFKHTVVQYFLSTWRQPLLEQNLLLQVFERICKLFSYFKKSGESGNFCLNLRHILYQLNSAHKSYWNFPQRMRESHLSVAVPPLQCAAISWPIGLGVKQAC